jgi:hypothetical protein
MTIIPYRRSRFMTLRVKSPDKDNKPFIVERRSGERFQKIAYFEEESDAGAFIALPQLLEACQDAAEILAQCQQAIELADLSLLPNEAQRLRAENNCRAAIEKTQEE